MVNKLLKTVLSYSMNFFKVWHATLLVRSNWGLWQYGCHTNFSCGSVAKIVKSCGKHEKSATLSHFICHTLECGTVAGIVRSTDMFLMDHEMDHAMAFQPYFMRIARINTI